MALADFSRKSPANSGAPFRWVGNCRGYASDAMSWVIYQVAAGLAVSTQVGCGLINGESFKGKTHGNFPFNLEIFFNLSLV